MTRKTKKQSELINNQELPFEVSTLPQRGTVYKDTCRQLTALRKAGKITGDEQLGTMAQARSLAAVIDRASGLGGRKQETYALAGLHRQLDELLRGLSGARGATDAAAAFLELMAGDDELEPTGGPARLEAAG
jgi:hypothetical protein